MKSFFLAVFLALFILCAWFFQQHIIELINLINDLGIIAPILFLMVYCLATILVLPTLVLTLAGGAIFGLYLGTLLNLLGATGGAGLSFLISRYLAYNWFEQRRGERLNRLIRGVEQRGWQFIAFLRLVPIVPFNLVNYGLGITRIGFKLYLLTTFIFLIPMEILYTYCGYAGIKVLSHPGEFYKNTGVVLLVVSTLIFTAYKYIKRRHLRSRPHPDPTPYPDNTPRSRT